MQMIRKKHELSMPIYALQAHVIQRGWSEILYSAPCGVWLLPLMPHGHKHPLRYE